METSELIKKGRELLAKASEGPWEHFRLSAMDYSPESRPRNGSVAFFNERNWVKCNSPETSALPESQYNAEFVVFSKNNMATLLDTLERYEEALKKIYEAETVNFREITWNPKKWESVHDLVRETAHEALNPKDTK